MKLVKSIILLLILVGILFTSITFISAAHVDDDMHSNDLSDLQTIDADLNHEDINTKCLNDDSVDKSLKAIDDSVAEQSKVSSNEIEVNNSALAQANDSSNINNKFQNSNISDLVDVNQTSDNIFTYVLDNVTYSVYRVPVYDYASFSDAINIATTSSRNYDMVLMDFKDNLKINVNMRDDGTFFGNVGNLVIRGNNAVISLNNPDVNDEKRLMEIDADDKLWMSNITIKGFNTAIMNYGLCQFSNVIFDSNRLCYLVHEDYGGAIRNHGILKCSNCTFSNNYAKYGGAVYNFQGSQAMFFDCIFKDNSAYGQAPGKLETNNGRDIFCCKGVNCIISNENDTYYSVLIKNTQEFNDVLNEIGKLGHVRVLVLNLTPGTNYKLSNKDGFKLSPDLVENLLIYGNGATISADTDDSDECHFLKVLAGQNFQIKDLTISGFNRAIFNEGSLSLTNITFRKNKCDYVINDDYGGAIYNDYGILYLTGCNFENGYAKYGGAIYNGNGIVRCDGCTFQSNTAYGDGGAIYNNKGHLTCLNTLFINNNAEDDGGAIYNYYGVAVLNDVTFNGNVADDEGGAIYNDFGTISLNNDIFIDSRADAGKDLFTYGDGAKYFVAGTSYSIYQVTDGFICQKIKVTSDTASEATRWVLRLTEVGFCVGLCIICSVSGMPEVAAGIIGFVGGGLFAAGEEIIEECYMDHNFNIANVAMMAVIAGAFDMVTTVVGNVIGKVFFHTGTKVLTKLAKFELSSICFAIEVAGEIITEVIPRCDFNEFEVPVPIENVTMQINQIS